MTGNHSNLTVLLLLLLLACTIGSFTSTITFFDDNWEHVYDQVQFLQFYQLKS